MIGKARIYVTQHLQNKDTVQQQIPAAVLVKASSEVKEGSSSSSKTQEGNNDKKQQMPRSIVSLWNEDEHESSMRKEKLSNLKQAVREGDMKMQASIMEHWNTKEEFENAINNKKSNNDITNNNIEVHDDDDNSSSSTSYSNNNNPFFEFSSGGILEIDNAYKLAMTEVSKCIDHTNGYFVAGSGWNQLWTRDTSYAIELATGLTHPTISKKSLQKCIRQDEKYGDVWLQDECGHFGPWPYLSDAIVGVRGAWSLYLTTGDEELLRWSYNITKNSLHRAEHYVYNSFSGLFQGCSSFMESNSGYPEKYRYNGRAVGRTKALSTNMLHFAGYTLGAKMGEILGVDKTEINELKTKGEKLRQAIYERLWLPDKGYYSYFEDEDENLVEQMEGLGEPFVLLDLLDEQQDKDRIASIFQNVHRTEHGIPSLWPQFHHNIERDVFDVYHNGRIWPFVQAYWALAAARHKQSDIFEEEFKSLLWLSQQGKTFAEFYHLDGSFLKSQSQQLWSDAGFLSMIFSGLFGLNFQPNGIKFDPIKPTKLFGETVSLKGVTYRKMTLDITITGSGSHITSFSIDGEQSSDPFVPSILEGKQTVAIILNEFVLESTK